VGLQPAMFAARPEWDEWAHRSEGAQPQAGVDTGVRHDLDDVAAGRPGVEDEEAANLPLQPPALQEPARLVQAGPQPGQAVLNAPAEAVRTGPRSAGARDSCFQSG
jgi:hypothetical protein